MMPISATFRFGVSIPSSSDFRSPTAIASAMGHQFHFVPVPVGTDLEIEKNNMQMVNVIIGHISEMRGAKLLPTQFSVYACWQAATGGKCIQLKSGKYPDLPIVGQS